jgi:hypothetical protein
MRIQSFTRYLSEESTGYAKLKSKKFRKIRFNEEEQSILQDEEGAAIVGVSLYIEENPEDENAYYNLFNQVKSHRKVDTGKFNDFEIFYSFSNSVRGDRRYGNAGWSARFLYEFLCARFNNGERFIDTYFNQLFTSRPVYIKLQTTVDYIQEVIAAKWNNGNLRGGQWSSFYKFQAAHMDYLKNSLEQFSRGIREDIILCLSTGMIPLNFSLSQSTIKHRLALGLPGDQPFYATSWLIKQIEIHVILGPSNAGQMFFSDSYTGE